MSKLTPFHLAIPVDNIPVCREFYKDILGCEEGRSSDHWVDFNLFGHQLVIHYKEKSKEQLHTNPVDGKDVPVPHFGVILEWHEWEELSKKLDLHKINFLVNPKVRFKNKPGEQGTFFIKDPSGNVLEFKTFKSDADVFKKF